MSALRAKTKTESSRREPLSRKIPGIANPIDIHVGGRVRLRRTLLGMSQEKLGEALGLTFQQVQKYERGANRVGASRLFDLSKILNVPVSFFFDDMPKDLGGEGSSNPGLAEEGDSYDKDPLARRETLELVRAYYRIPNAQIRRKVFELAKSLSMSGDAADEA
ncbi:MAG: helix-turn-helix domain-containing protein [Rhodospirillales bacterium]|nr:helix-turn-helix domain-containing protein [Rhodospirillales bacterium]MCW8863158.1 helix-turn-helix domain-containing protein [Rhodospirillales bacterium]MCW8951833.1 helix-turn-helix domain-containing protein [Rhodospirillales bacterium]MCW8970328.1 helix-turn-helix domain-containing protein [Rhodospirillales bacterium]MCW9003437.1 helix-turn-helix domain-containing protein [Rhodospirillales bacterium]